MTPYLDHHGPLVLAHRGFSLDGLENSMPAFAAAVELGVRHVETDVHTTSDGVVLAFHDEDLDRVTDATGVVAELPWSRVSQARIGGVEPIPTLEELLATWPDLHVNIDVKSDAAVAPTASVVNRMRAHHRVCIASFSDRRRRAVLSRLERPTVASAGEWVVRAFVAATTLRAGPALRLALRGVDCLQVPERSGRVTIVTPRSVAAADAAGVPVHVWTVNDARDMHRLLDMGVAGLVTDRADVAREVLVERGEWHG